MRREWTEYEEKYMNKHYLYQSTKKTAEFLNRSIYSVKRKATQLGLNAYCSDKLNARTVAKCFGVDTAVVLRWIHKLNLPAREVNAETQIRYLIDAEEFWKWAEQNKFEINWSRYELCSILPEPRWVEFEKSRYKTTRHRKRFTDNEIVQVKHMIHRGMTFKEIAAELGRTDESIKHLFRKLKKAA